MAERDDLARRQFDDFVRAETSALLRTAYLLAGDRQHAEDLVQTALARVVGRWHKIDDPVPYVQRVLYTQFVSWWRRHRRIRVVETLTADVPDRQAALPPEPELSVVLRRALGRLTPRQRAVLVLRFYEDRSEAETAARLGCRLGTVKSQTRHALSRLRQLAPELAELADASRTEVRT
jgi:RNA polymerase sigma-70 factor (sigma-E family)